MLSLDLLKGTITSNYSVTSLSLLNSQIMANTILLRYSTTSYLGDPSPHNLTGAKHGTKLVLPQSTKAKVQSLAVLLVFLG